MPRGDGTGPIGGGRGAGIGGGRGRNGGPLAAGPSGMCVCPKCGATMPHRVGVPCTSVTCPKCGAKMTRG